MTNETVQPSDSTPASLTNDAPPLVRVIHITRDIAQRVLDTIDAGLVHGLGAQAPGEMCVEAAVCHALGLPHGDDPGCVAESLRRLKIRLNDAPWSSPQARARGLRRLGLVQLASKNVLDEHAFVARVVHLAITKCVPAALRAAASIHEAPQHQAALEGVAAQWEREATLTSYDRARGATRALANQARDVVHLPGNVIHWATDTAEAAVKAARSATAAIHTAANAAFAPSIASAVRAAASYFAEAAEQAAACAQNAASVACLVTSTNHARDPSRVKVAEQARDRALAEFAEDVVQVLIEMKAPGCQWLDLCA